MKLMVLSPLLLTAALANAQTYGSWTVAPVPSEGGVMAWSSNDSGGTLMKFCNAQHCLWAVTTKVSCREGNEYPALLNADAGSLHLTIACRPTAVAPGRYVIHNPDAMDRSVEQGRLVGIAIPTESGDFRVSRYPVSGWAQAHGRLLELARNVPPSTRDVRL